LEIEQKIVAEVNASGSNAQTADVIAAKLGLEPQSELIFKLLLRLAANNRGISANTKIPIHETAFFAA
jgi:hypothetical protein